MPVSSMASMGKRVFSITLPCHCRPLQLCRCSTRQALLRVAASRHAVRAALLLRVGIVQTGPPGEPHSLQYPAYAALLPDRSVSQHLTRRAPVPLSACTVALRPSAMTLLCSPKASLALSSLNLGFPVMPRYSCDAAC